MAHKKVRCFFCGKPIKMEEFGGVLPLNGKMKLFCRNIDCLIKLVEMYED